MKKTYLSAIFSTLFLLVTANTSAGPATNIHCDKCSVGGSTWLTQGSTKKYTAKSNNRFKGTFNGRIELMKYVSQPFISKKVRYKAPGSSWSGYGNSPRNIKFSKKGYYTVQSLYSGTIAYNSNDLSDGNQYTASVSDSRSKSVYSCGYPQCR